MYYLLLALKLQLPTSVSEIPVATHGAPLLQIIMY